MPDRVVIVWRKAKTSRHSELYEAKIAGVLVGWTQRVGRGWLWVAVSDVLSIPLKNSTAGGSPVCDTLAQAKREANAYIRKAIG